MELCRTLSQGHARLMHKPTRKRRSFPRQISEQSRRNLKTGTHSRFNLRVLLVVLRKPDGEDHVSAGPRAGEWLHQQ